jgi:hypothetical protein
MHSTEIDKEKWINKVDLYSFGRIAGMVVSVALMWELFVTTNTLVIINDSRSDLALISARLDGKLYGYNKKLRPRFYSRYYRKSDGNVFSFEFRQMPPLSSLLEIKYLDGTIKQETCELTDKKRKGCTYRAYISSAKLYCVCSSYADFYD